MNLKTMTKDAAPNSSFVTAILIITSILGFFSRLFAVIRLESIIHEFDPYGMYAVFWFWGFLARFS